MNRLFILKRIRYNILASFDKSNKVHIENLKKINLEIKRESKK